MRKFLPFRKLLLATLAMVFAAAVILYTGLWMYLARWLPPVELGFDDQYVASGQYDLVTGVEKGSPAERAGLQPGDRILVADGHPLESPYDIGDIWARHRPGQSVELTIQRDHAPAPLTLRGIFRARRATSTEGGISRRLGEDITDTYPLGFLVVGLAVLFLRLEDLNAWLLALMFASFIALPAPPASSSMGPSLRPFALAYRAIFDSVLPAIFCFFFSIFPTRSRLDGRAPWLKWVGLGLGISVASSGLAVGESRPPAVLIRLVGAAPANFLRLSYSYGFVGLGLVSLISNAFSASTPEARRKIRVVLWGTLAGVVPAALSLLACDILMFRWPLWLGVVVVLLLWLLPLSFAYAVIKHRVLEIPVLLRRGARYLLVQRGFTVLLIVLIVGATSVFALTLSRYLEPLIGAALPAGIASGAGFGTLLLWTGMRVHKRVGGRIDRAFFRNAYDARMILGDLAEKTRTATDRTELAALLEHYLHQALQPSALVVYLETADGQLSAARGNVPPDLQTLSATEPTMADLARYGRPWEGAAERPSGTPGPNVLAPLQPDCLVPMLGRDGRLVGLVVLGPRLSEEPYSREDKHLLASVASQAGIALESIYLGEKIAERIEAERRAAQEMEFAREVQTRLFPQKLPPLETLQYTGGCIPARQVGGDYYDFLELRPGRLALVLADIAGKGVSGALLMANLQANLRSQYAMALDDLPRLLASVNHLFYENTPESSYATLFFGDYDDSGRRLRYVNCGHLPPLLLRADGRLDRLTTTATVLGLFENWECSVREAQLAPGDTLVLYTDGVTEAASAAGEEFGESRLIETLRAQRHLPVHSLLETIVATVQVFSHRELADDITLVVGRCRS
jgi:sigma-B regulation protein RsbU (phosphoserine phosphatase)